MEIDDISNGAMDFDRSVDQVRQVIQLAKLEDTDLVNYSQVISFRPQLLGDEVKLIHVSKEMADSVEQGDTLYLRGSDEEPIVLCSKNKTYDFKEAETSNSMLLLPSLSLSKESTNASGNDRTLAWRNVTGIFYKYFELQEIRPRITKLRSVLKTLTEDDVKTRNCVGQSFNQLLDMIQSSEKQLEQGLTNLEAVQFEGAYYLLEQEYQMKVLSYILKLFNENSWPLDCVKKQETVETLADLVNTEVLSQVFDIYCTPMRGGTDNQYSLDKHKVSRFYGDFLLIDGSNFALEEFLDMWQKALPEGIQADIAHLSGLALVETLSTTSNQNCVKRFPESSLPTTIQDRLEVVFSAREKWSLEELTPYIEPLTTPKLNVNALLTKYARPVTINGTKYFCAKHGK